MKKCWEFRNSAGKSAELLIYGEISDETWFGDEVTPKQFKEELDALGAVDELTIYINSGGGDVFAGEAIYNILSRCTARKTAVVDGLAASIASHILMAADEIVMPENAMIMIHNAWTIAAGNREDMLKIADTLGRIDGILRDTYVKRTGCKAEDVEAWMDAETWMTAAEALERGFCDRIDDSKRIAASVTGKSMTVNGQTFDIARYHNVPEIDPCNGADEPQPVEDIHQKALKDQREHFAEMRKKIINTYTEERKGREND